MTEYKDSSKHNKSRKKITYVLKEALSTRLLNQICRLTSTKKILTFVEDTNLRLPAKTDSTHTHK